MALCPLSCSLLASQQAARAAGAVRLPGSVMFVSGMLVGLVTVASIWRARQSRGTAQPASGGRGATPLAAPVAAAPVATGPAAAATESCLFLPGTGRALAADYVAGLVSRCLRAGELPPPDAGVAVAAGPRGIVEQLLCRTAAALAAEVPPTGPDVILVAFPEFRRASGRITCCDGLSSALDRVASIAVSRQGQGDRLGGLTVLVSRVSPAPAELALLVDLAAETGLAALVPRGESCRQAGQYQELRVDQAQHDQDMIVITVDQPAPALPWRDPVEEPQRTEPQHTEPQHAEPQHTEPQRMEPRASHARPAAPGLRIGVLGALTVNGQAGGVVPAQSQLLLALALAGSAGLSNRQLCERLGPDPDHPRPTDSLRQLITRTRRQMGQAADGREWIEHRGHGQYALHPDAKTDWLEFDALASAGTSAKDAALLTEALSKVRGEPFAECYYWWIDLTMIEVARERIVTTAAALADIRLADRDPAASARAARLGLAADPSAEQLWRALMRAEHASGNLSGVREAWSRCQIALADIAADGRPDSSTAALYDKLVNIN